MDSPINKLIAATVALTLNLAGIIANIVLMAVDSDKAGMHGGIIGGLCGAVAGCSYYVNKMRDEVGEGAGTLIFWTVLLTLNLAGIIANIVLMAVDSDKAGMHGGIIGGLLGACAGCGYMTNETKKKLYAA